MAITWSCNIYIGNTETKGTLQIYKYCTFENLQRQEIIC